MSFKEDNLIQKKTFDFALKIIQFYSYCKSQNEFILSKQILRCGTSIGANVEEAIAAQSKKDFISKLSIANKEARETKYWLNLLTATDYLDEKLSKSLIDDAEELSKILSSILLSSKQNNS